jgi:putative transcriptional regulator
MHPNTDYLIEYASGSLSIAICISVTTHLQFCEECRVQVDAFHQIGGELLTNAPVVTLSEGLLESVLGSLRDETVEQGVVEKAVAKDRVNEYLPAYVQNLLPEGDLKWRFLSPSVRAASIGVGETRYELALHRLKAGGHAPTHDHRGDEITVVLLGSFSDEDGVYQPGDYIVRNPGDVHRPQAARHNECICLSVLAAPIKLVGLKRIMNPFLSFSPQ